jgi:hypothetical protein
MSRGCYGRHCTDLLQRAHLLRKIDFFHALLNATQQVFRSLLFKASEPPLFAVVQDADMSPHQTPRILNAQNGKYWIGAYFDYLPAFRDQSCLAPGEITEAITWKAQPLASERTFVTLNFSLSHERPKP